MTEQTTDQQLPAIQLNTKANLLKELSEDIPQNDFGLPDYYYRTDLLPDMTHMEETQRIEYLQMAAVELDYSQGYPLLPTGEPFWSQLPHEPPEAYRAFVAYMDTPRPENRRISSHVLKNKPHPLECGVASAEAQSARVALGDMPIRQLHLLTDLLGLTMEKVLTYVHTYCWAGRVKAYDLFTAAAHKKRRQQRRMDLEDDHYDKANFLMQRAYAQLMGTFDHLATLDEDDPDKFSAMKPKDLLDMIDKMAKLQRVAVGLTANGASAASAAKDATPANANLEVIMRTLAKATGDEVKKDTNSDTTKQLLQDPAALQQAQELIIRMGDMGAGRTSALDRQNGSQGTQDSIDTALVSVGADEEDLFEENFDVSTL